MEAKEQRAENLEGLLDEISRAQVEREAVTARAILAEVGQRSFGPLMLLAGLITLAPVIGDIPGVPTLVGIFVLLISVQLLIRREHFWLPRWMLNRSLSEKKLTKAVRWSRRPAKFIDKLLRRRLPFFVCGPGVALIAGICACIGLMMPLMEVIPFSANLAGAGLLAFGLALIASDGLLALVAFVMTGATAALALYYFLT